MPGGGAPPHRLRPNARDLRRIAERHVEALSDDDLDVLGYDIVARRARGRRRRAPRRHGAADEGSRRGGVRGRACSRSCSRPRRCRSASTCPPRSVVIEKLSKFTGEHHEFLTPGEYTQLAGRAGRRGIDDLGYVVVLWDPFVPFEQVAGLASRRTYALTSSFRPDVQHGREPRAAVSARAGAPLAQPVVRAVPRRPRRRRRRARTRTPPRSNSTRADGTARRTRAATSTSTGASSPTSTPANGPATADQATRLDGAPARRRRRRAAAAGGKVVVLKQEQGRGGDRVLALTQGRDARAARPERLPAVRSARSRRSTCPGRSRRAARRSSARPSTRSRRLHLDDVRSVPVDTDRARRRTAGRGRAHPLHDAPGVDAALRGRVAGRAASTRDVARLERRVASRDESLARQFDRVLGVLEAWGYVDGWALTDAGELLARLNTEGDLVARRSAARRDCSTGSIRADARRGSCRASRSSAAARTATSRCRPATGRARASPAGPRDSNAIWRDLHVAERDAAAARDPPARSRLHRRDPLLGQPATSSPTCSRTRR